MLPDLAQFIGATKFEQLKGKYVLLTDSRADGQFMVHHFLTQALKDGVTTYFVTFAQAVIHYSAIASKLGANLSKFLLSGHLVYIDGLTHLHDNTHTDLSKEQDTKKAICFSLDKSKPNCLVGLYSFLSHLIKPRLSSGQPVAVIIDDLSVLLGQGVGLGEVEDFVHYCQVLVCHSMGESTGALFTMVHADDDVGEGQEQLLERHLAHRSDLRVCVSGLESGHSKDVHGEITTTRWTSPRRESSVVTMAQFKLTDRNIHVFPKGLSPAVL